MLRIVSRSVSFDFQKIGPTPTGPTSHLIEDMHSCIFILISKGLEIGQSPRLDSGYVSERSMLICVKMEGNTN